MAAPPANQIEHHGQWDIDHDFPAAVRNTGIICTIGPASNSVDKLVELIKSGMNIARLNFSHGNHKFHKKTIESVREAVKQVPNCHVAIALDTKGREIRTGDFKKGIKEIDIETDGTLTLSTNEKFKDCGDQNTIYVDYENITKVVSINSLIYIDDGLICLKVTEIVDDRLITKVENGGKIGSRKGVNLPNVEVDLSVISDQDIGDLKFGVEQKVDMVFASFIQKASDVITIRNILGDKGKHIAIVPKIENHAGVQNFDEILKESDGIMVARGDLGIEIPPEKVFLAQKMMISKCNIAGKPVIVATHMLESMIKNPRPTRAEANDVANAVLDGTDCVMLSGETAKGEHPIKSVEIMSKICKEAEAAMPNRVMYNELCQHTPTPTPTTTTTTIAAVDAALTQDCAAIICLTTTGNTAFSLSKYRPRCPIITITRDRRTARMCNLHRAVHPYVYSKQISRKGWIHDVEERLEEGIQFGRGKNIIHSGSTVVLVNGSKSGPGHTNTIRIRTVE